MLLTVTAAVATGLMGCGPSEEERRLQRAMFQIRMQPDPNVREAVATLAARRCDDRHENEFVQYCMCEVTAATFGGQYRHAMEVGKHAYAAMKKYQDAGRETRAAWGNEAIKFFKGEPHERAMLCCHLGLLCYMEGDYNNARIFFAQSLHSTATRDEDMKDHRDDFRLGHYWLGRAYLRLGDGHNARIAFSKAMDARPLPEEGRDLARMKKSRNSGYKTQMKLEKTCYEKGTGRKQPVAGIVNLSQPLQREEMPLALHETAHPPTDGTAAADLTTFLDPAFQGQANLILVVELGAGPIKYLTGASGAIDKYARHPHVERAVDVYVDGYRAGPAFCLLDMYHQAITRGVQTRRGRQVGKAVTKEVLKRVPLVGGFFGYWDVAADGRYWPSLPDQVAVFAARVEPGFHDIALRFYDVNGAYLPRFDVNRHCLYVPQAGERLLLFHSVENQDNAYMLTQATSDE